uniref:TIDP3431 n=1 Tax=Arundo donax TaxID=35708 RepID=A0A0A9HKB1_ARUDO
MSTSTDWTYWSMKSTVTPNAAAIASIVTLLYDSRNCE